MTTSIDTGKLEIDPKKGKKDSWAERAIIAAKYSVHTVVPSDSEKEKIYQRVQESLCKVVDNNYSPFYYKKFKEDCEIAERQGVGVSSIKKQIPDLYEKILFQELHWVLFSYEDSIENISHEYLRDLIERAEEKDFLWKLKESIYELYQKVLCRKIENLLDILDNTEISEPESRFQFLSSQILHLIEKLPSSELVLKNKYLERLESISEKRIEEKSSFSQKFAKFKYKGL